MLAIYTGTILFDNRDLNAPTKAGLPKGSLFIFYKFCCFCARAPCGRPCPLPCSGGASRPLVFMPRMFCGFWKKY